MNKNELRMWANQPTRDFTGYWLACRLLAALGETDNHYTDIAKNRTPPSVSDLVLWLWDNCRSAPLPIVNQCFIELQAALPLYREGLHR